MTITPDEVVNAFSVSGSSRELTYTKYITNTIPDIVLTVSNSSDTFGIELYPTSSNGIRFFSEANIPINRFYPLRIPPKVSSSFTNEINVLARINTETFNTLPITDTRRDFNIKFDLVAVTSSTDAVAPNVTINNQTATLVATELDRFTLERTSLVAYGAFLQFGSAERFVSRVLNAGQHVCSTATFGADPSPGNFKSCFVLESGYPSEDEKGPAERPFVRPITQYAAKIGTRAAVYMRNYQFYTVPVRPKEVYRVSGWVYAGGTTFKAVSSRSGIGGDYALGYLLIQTDSTGVVKNYGPVKTAVGPIGWKYVSKDIEIVDGATHIQFGPHIDGPYPLVRDGNGNSIYGNPVCTEYESSEGGCPGFAWFADFRIVKVKEENGVPTQLQINLNPDPEWLDGPVGPDPVGWQFLIGRKSINELGPTDGVYHSVPISTAPTGSGATFTCKEVGQSCLTSIECCSQNCVGSSTVGFVALGTCAAAPPQTQTVNTISLFPTAATIRVGETVLILATPLNINNQILQGKTIVWTTSNVDKATVESSGLVTAKSTGTVTIVATSEGKTAEAVITILANDGAQQNPVQTVTVVPNVVNLTVGATQQLTTQLVDAPGNILAGRTVVWASSDTSKVSINATGLVTAVTAGSATISATSEGKVGTATVSVTLPPEPTPTPTPSQCPPGQYICGGVCCNSEYCCNGVCSTIPCNADVNVDLITVIEPYNICGETQPCSDMGVCPNGFVCIGGCCSSLSSI